MLETYVYGDQSHDQYEEEENAQSNNKQGANLLDEVIVLVGGPAQKMLFFQMVPKSFLSVPIYSTRCKYDSLDFFKNFDWNLPVGRVKVKIVEFWLE